MGSGVNFFAICFVVCQVGRSLSLDANVLSGYVLFACLCEQCNLSIIYGCHLVDKIVPQIQCQIDFILFV